ncbi:MAG: hypothetical protein ISS25_03220 [Nanoarchaeota archaeon]|nr:hypothetical protein [DPANN group archaeon]MBL7116812.1 hypothetical protein [Nanoarchaeota archaeon]
MSKYVEEISKATSVKRIGLILKPSPESPGIGDMDYRPVFSVFDYGTIEPSVPLDNSTVALMAGFNFEFLRDQNIDSHFLGMVNEDGSLTTTKNAISRSYLSNIMRVRFVNRLLPEFRNGSWDYSVFQDSAVNNYVQPIEFIMRNELPESSSVWRRVKNRELTLADIGLPDDFKPGMPIPEELGGVMLDFSTKFEPDDRYLTPEQARELMSLSPERFEGINETTKIVNRLMTDYAESRGFRRLDGKFEYVVIVEDGEPKDVLADAVCTWHEDRLTWDGFGVSKQRIRDEVKKLNPMWYADIQRAKEQAKEEGVADFRDLMDKSIEYTSPSSAFFEAINTLFQAATNQWIGERLYSVGSKEESLEDSLNRAVEEFEKAKL